MAEVTRDFTACKWRNIEIEEKNVQMVDITNYLTIIFDSGAMRARGIIVLVKSN